MESIKNPNSAVLILLYTMMCIIFMSANVNAQQEKLEVSDFTQVK